MSIPETNPWWHDFHDELLAQILLERKDEAEVTATLDFIVASLELPAGARVYDQCCGIGSLSRRLAHRGYNVIGVDQARGYIDRAISEAEAEAEADSGSCLGLGQRLRYVAADAREFCPSEPVDGVFNWWTSFGYGSDDADNARMLARAFDSLRPGGRLLLDTMNAAGVLRRFQPDVVIRREIDGGELMLLRESTIDLAKGVLEKRWTYILPDRRHVEHRSRVRLYHPHELAKLLRGVGFAEVELFGGIAGEPLTLDTLRCICRARRPS